MWLWPTLAKPTLAKTKFGQTKLDQNQVTTSDQDNFCQTGLCTCCAPNWGIQPLKRPGTPRHRPPDRHFPPSSLRTQFLVLRVVVGVLGPSSGDPSSRGPPSNGPPSPGPSSPGPPKISLFFPSPAPIFILMEVFSWNFGGVSLLLFVLLLLFILLFCCFCCCFCWPLLLLLSAAAFD